jgi:Holliday junction resolvasome RuvABC endonuclease subunit
MILKVVGFDPSMNNWGIATGTYDTESRKVTIYHLDVTNAVLPTGKQVRQNSKDLEAAQQLYAGALKVIDEAHAIFVEVPVGSKSARAMASYGICIGILGGLRASGTPFFEVTPTEVKVAATGLKTATKKQMIDWGVSAHPEAPWPTYKRKGELVITESTAEHMADAVGAIYAGLATNQFKQSLHFMR